MLLHRNQRLFYLRQVLISYSQPYFKKLYRFLSLRKYLLGINTSGLYNKNILKDAAIHSGINYNTLRADISFFEQKGWLQRSGKYLRLLRLSTSIYKFTRFSDISNSDIEFCDLVKKKIFFSGLYRQAKKESEKINDKKISKKYLKTVRGSISPIGVNHGIYCSIETIGRIFSKSSSTAKRYISGLKNRHLISVFNNSKVIGEAKDYDQLKRMPELINRIFMRENTVFLRLTNSYKF